MNIHIQLETILKDVGKNQFKQWYKQGQDKYKPLNDEYKLMKDCVRQYVIRQYYMWYESISA